MCPWCGYKIIFNKKRCCHKCGAPIMEEYCGVYYDELISWSDHAKYRNDASFYPLENVFYYQSLMGMIV